MIFVGIAAAIGVVTLGIIIFRTLVSSPEGGADEPMPVVTVSVAPVIQTTLYESIAAWGTVEPEPANVNRPAASARVASPMPGIVAQVNSTEGERVAKGSVLFRLDSRVADVAVEKARQAVGYAEQVFARQKQLGPGEATSVKAYQDAEQALVAARNELANAEAQRALLVILSPLSGTIARVNAKPGDAVDLTTVLAEIIDLDRLVVTAAVPAEEVAKVRPSQRVEIHPASGTPEQLSARPIAEGRVVFVAPQVDSRTNTVVVRASVPAGAAVRPGQFVNVRIITDERKDRLAVPAESIVTEAGTKMIAIVNGDTATKIPVTTGIRDGNLVEVEAEGLRPGVTVVTSGVYGLPDKSKIQVRGQ
jgi:membrane fusion protein (multidrug efflux system)